MKYEGKFSKYKNNIYYFARIEIEAILSENEEIHWLPMDQVDFYKKNYGCAIKNGIAYAYGVHKKNAGGIIVLTL